MSTAVAEKALGFLSDLLDALSDPRRWCKGAFAVDAAGKALEGPDQSEVVARPEVTARCVFGHALYLARRRRWRIELAVVEDTPISLELRRAPESFRLAALALAFGAAELADRYRSQAEAAQPESTSEPKQLRLSRLLLLSVVANDLPQTTHEDVVSIVLSAMEWLRMQLAQAKKEER